jgi:hypothetical protein
MMNPGSDYNGFDGKFEVVCAFAKKCRMMLAEPWNACWVFYRCSPLGNRTWWAELYYVRSLLGSYYPSGRTRAKAGRLCGGLRFYRSFLLERTGAMLVQESVY